MSRREHHSEDRGGQERELLKNHRSVAAMGRRAAMAAARAGAAAAVGGVVAAGVTSVWPTHLQLGPTDSELSLSSFRFGSGLTLKTSFGPVTLPDSHAGPGLEADLMLNDGILETIANPNGLSSTVSTIEADAKANAPAALFELEGKTMLGFLVGGSLVILPAYRRRPETAGHSTRRKAAAIGALAALELVYTAGLPAMTYNRDPQQRIQYGGPLAEAQGYFADYQRLDALNKATAGPVSNFMRLIEALRSTSADQPVDPVLCLLVASDAHGGGYSLLQQMYQRDKEGENCVQASVLSGDFDDRGESYESMRPSHTEMNNLVRLMQTFAVQGNHDSAATIDDLRSRGAKMLDGAAAVTFEGLNVFGIPDANFSPGNEMPQSEYDSRESENARAYAQTDRGPIDILIAHNPKTAQAFIDAYPGPVRVALVGHTHKSEYTMYKGVPMINPGTLSGAGLRILDNGAPQPLGAAEIRYRRADDGSLVPYSVTQLNYDLFDPNKRSVQTSPIAPPGPNRPGS